MRAPAKALWRVEVVVPEPAVALFEAALARGALALSAFLVATEKRAEVSRVRVQSLTAEKPNRAEIGARLALAAAAAGVPIPRCDISPHAEVAQLEGEPPIRIGRFRIAGSVLRGRLAPAGTTLVLDAGPAFGSGRHESTQGALLAMDGLARRRRFRRALDLGTGSGILAMAMARIWRTPVVAADIDARAVAVARDNARANGLGPWIRFVVSTARGNPVLACPRAYDLIAANILAAPLIALAPALARTLGPAGIVVLSGFLAGEEPAVRAAYRCHGMVLAHRITLGGWRTLVLARPAPRGRA